MEAKIVVSKDVVQQVMQRELRVCSCLVNEGENYSIR